MSNVRLDELSGFRLDIAEAITLCGVVGFERIGQAVGISSPALVEKYVQLLIAENRIAGWLYEGNSSSVDPFALPSAAMAERHLLPYASAVYFVIEPPNRVIYIGQSRRLVHRFREHTLRREFAEFQSLLISWLEVDDTQTRKRMERELIYRFRPQFNFIAEGRG